MTAGGIAAAFAAGLLSFVSPCVLPLVPSYITFITGLTLDDVRHARRTSVTHALLFVAGFSGIFLALGATATVVGRLLAAHRHLLSRAGGLLVIAFGAYTLGVLPMRGLARDRRFHFADKPLGGLGTVLVGVAFGAGWTPCIGPILGTILIYASTVADLGRGIALLAAYSLGLAVPFLLSAVAVGRFLATAQRLRSHMPLLARVSGALLIAVGVFLLVGEFTTVARWLQDRTPQLLRSRL